MNTDGATGAEVDLAAVTARLKEALIERGVQVMPAYRVAGMGIPMVNPTINEQLQKLQALNRPRTELPQGLQSMLVFRLPVLGMVLRRAVLSLHARAFTDQRRINALVIECLTKSEEANMKLANSLLQLDVQLTEFREQFITRADDS